MKPYKDYAPKEPAKTQEQLPIGGYVLKILEAKEVEYTWGNVLLISFDIAEGEYKNFYKNNYNAQQQEDKKWKGTYRLNEPKDDGSEKDGWTKNTFDGAMWAFENSNTGYHWDWDETKLKGKIVGGLFRNKEYKFKGNRGFFTECCRLDAAETIRKGEFKMPKDKLLSNSNDAVSFASPESGGFEDIKSDDDLPF